VYWRAWLDKFLGRSAPAPAPEPRGEFDPAPPKPTADAQAMIDEKQREFLLKQHLSDHRTHEPR
jgi:hypothetical protein